MVDDLMSHKLLQLSTSTLVNFPHIILFWGKLHVAGEETPQEERKDAILPIHFHSSYALLPYSVHSLLTPCKTE
jgi:hypothetical protein